MQAFNLFFKIIKTQLGQVIMYILIFTGIASAVAGQKLDDDSLKYKSSSLKISIVDEDNTASSKSLFDALSLENELVELADYEESTIQDELYNRNVSNVIIIPKGFEASLIAGNNDNPVKVYNLPGTMMGSIITSTINNYVKTFAAYIQSGFSVSDAIGGTNESLEEAADVEVLANDDALLEKLCMYLQYIAYVFIAIAAVSVAPIIQIINKHDIRSRINCSSYKITSFNLSIFAAITSVGLLICGVFTAITYINIGDIVFTKEGLLYILNMIVFMCVAMSLAFLIGTITTTLNVISMLANVIGLGCSFLGGIFVPIELLSDTVLKIAHFLPSYWYVITGKTILTLGEDGKVADVAKDMGIQLLFALAFLAISLVVQNRKRTAR